MQARALTRVASKCHRWRRAEAINDAWYASHPVIREVPAALRIPFGIHGDDAGVHGQHQTFVLTWGGVASKMATLDSRIIFSMVSLHAALGQSTEKHVVNATVPWHL